MKNKRSYISQHKNKIKYCRVCNVKLDNINWYKSSQKIRSYICKVCLIKWGIGKRKNNPDFKKRERLYRKRTRERLKLEALSNYCGGEIKCMNPLCAVNGSMKDVRALSIDHINGGGTQHRIKLFGGKGNMYWWLRKNNYPSGYQVLCMNCQFIKRHKNKEWS